MIMDTVPERLICRNRWSEEEAWKVLSYHRSKALRLFRVLMNLLFVAFLVFAFWALVTQGNRSSPVLLLVISLYGLFFRQLGARWWHRRRFRLRPDRDALVEYRFSDAGISFAAEGLGEGRATWASVFKVLRVSDGVLIYPNERVMYWIPDRGFTSVDAVGEVDRLLRAKVPRYESL
jgi:hypothetical protein